MFAKIIKKEENKEPNAFTRLELLAKLRLVISSAFAFLTLGIVLMIANVWAVGVILAILGYLVVFFLMIKLLMIKKL